MATLYRAAGIAASFQAHHFLSCQFSPIEQNQNNLAKTAQHLILVAGHSVTVSGHLEDAGSDETDWFLLSYQKGQVRRSDLLSTTIFYILELSSHNGLNVHF